MVGMPSIDYLEQRWGHQWRQKSERVYFSNRKSIITEVIRLAQERGLPEEVIARQMDEDRGTDSLDKLIKAIKAENKKREGG